MAVVGSYAVSIIERHLERAAEQAEFHAAKTVYKSPQSFQQRKLSSPSPSVRSPQPNSYIPPQTFRKPVSKVETESVEEQVKLLKWAIQSNQKVRFSYETRNGEKSERTVTPINFKTVEQTLCLESYCHLRNAKRSFALKRMRDIEIISASQANYEQVTSDLAIAPPDVQTKISPASQFPSSEVTQTNNYQQLTSDEVITPSNVEVKVSPALQSPLPKVCQTKNRDNQVKQRPYLKYRTAGA